MFRKVVARKSRAGFHRHQEAEPRRIALIVFLEEPQLRQILQPLVEPRKVCLALLDERRELLELRTANRRLEIGCLEVVTKMGIDVLVVVAERQRAKLLGETASACVVHARFTPAVAPPVPHGQRDLL